MPPIARGLFLLVALAAGFGVAAGYGTAEAGPALAVHPANELRTMKGMGAMEGSGAMEGLGAMEAMGAMGAMEGMQGPEGMPPRVCTMVWDRPHPTGHRLDQTFLLLARTSSGVGPWVAGWPSTVRTEAGWGPLLLLGMDGALEPPASSGVPLNLMEGPGGRPLFTWLDPVGETPPTRFSSLRSFDARLVSRLWESQGGTPDPGAGQWGAPEAVASFEQVLLSGGSSVVATRDRQGRIVHLMRTREDPVTFLQHAAIRSPGGTWSMGAPRSVRRQVPPTLSTGAGNTVFLVHGGTGASGTDRHTIYLERLPQLGPFEGTPIPALRVPVRGDGVRAPALFIDTRGTMHLATVAAVSPPEGSSALEVWYARSTDGGERWTDPVRLASMGSRQVDRPPAFLEDPEGGMHLFLSSHQGTGSGTLLHLSLSRQIAGAGGGGEHGWSEPVPVRFGLPADPDGQVFHGVVAAGADGTSLAAAFTGVPAERGGAGVVESLTTFLVEGRWRCPG